ncbi:MAG TPA: 7-cyano-7-deazaguanine synthase QueC [Spirochaetota bacterium]|nr:7-cyano-7-deazaguanine synthase QueC [Spirochaetota bacterium]HOM39094.1 7-cyano-7-deazaguanine synthase QueC [Spirochaetota bacterium]HPQ49587.1 7-cyano-7-deazaguanine synthase QueC [Spirochaetota bacterium]
MKKAVVLLSGGLDSATTAAIARSEGYEIYAITFSYGQRHKIEIKSAKRIAKEIKVKEHKIIKIDLRTFGGSSLTDNIDVPKERDIENIKEIPLTYVPARNTIFLSYALAYAEVIDADSIFIGVNAIDYSGYPDCRPEYIKAFNEVSRLGTKKGVEGRPILIKTPIINMTKKEIIKKGLELGLDFSKTHSCYDPIKGKACGKCDSCLIRKRAFLELGIEDPTKYYNGE